MVVVHKYSTIPKSAKPIYKGKIFSLYKWKQKLYDGSYADYEGVRRKDSVFIIAVVGKKIAVADVTEPGWRGTSLISGRMEDGEKPLATARRELSEESGLSSEDFEMLETLRPTGIVEWYIHLYAARNCKKIGKQNLDSGEKISIRELSLDEFLKETREFGLELNGYFSQFRESQARKNWLRKKLGLT